MIESIYKYSAETLTPEVIAAGTYLTTNTVKKYLPALISKRLVTDEYALAPDFQCSDNENFFTLPNEIFLLKLPPSAFMVYAFLLLIEDRRTHTCHPSYNTIATGTGMSKNTALKSISTLLEAGLIAAEPSSYFDNCGMKWKGNNLYTILPIRSAVDIFYQRQLYQVELATEQTRIRKRQESGTRAALWAGLWASCHPGQLLTPPKPKTPLWAICGVMLRHRFRNHPRQTAENTGDEGKAG